MSMDISVHDNALNSYCVNAERAEITLHTSYAHQNRQEYSDVVFSGVVAYNFERDSFGTIIFDIDETTVESIYTDERERFESGRKYCWPGTWNKSDDSVLTYLLENEIKGYWLSSSFGMVGWVLAKSMKIVNTVP